MIAQLKELSQNQTDGASTSGSSLSPHDLYSQVRGEERGGRVRMCGLGITPSDIFGPPPKKLELLRRNKEVEEEARSLRVELTNQKEKLEAMQQQINMLIQMQIQKSSGQVAESSTAPNSSRQTCSAVPNSSRQTCSTEDNSSAVPSKHKRREKNKKRKEE